MEALRVGVSRALVAVMSAWESLEMIASVILPTRYGKSDVIRLAALSAIQAGLSEFSLVMVPYAMLADQILDKRRTKETLERAQMVLPFPLKMIRIEGNMLGTQVHPSLRNTLRANGEHIVSITSQLAFMNQERIIDWLEAEMVRSGKPPLIIVDECDQVAGNTGWVEFCKAAQSIGCRFLVLTATPLRSDKDDIFGFEYETKDNSQEGKIYKTRDHEDPMMIWIDRYAATYGERKIIPTYSMLYSEAYKETPRPIARAAMQWVDVPMDDGKMLHDYSASDVRKKSLLSKAVTDERVIRDCLSRAVDCLGSHRSYQGRERTSMMIFVGSDFSDKDERNAKRARKILAELDPTLRIEIVERGDPEIDEPDSLLKQFRDGTAIDVVIVKQMGAVGMDSLRLKVVVDLSPVRTLPSCVQRWFRGGTIWGNVDYFDLILPRDQIAENIYEFVRCEESGRKAMDNQKFTTVGDYEKSKEAVRDDDPAVSPEVAGSLFGNFTDTDGNEGLPDQIALVMAVRLHCPNDTQNKTNAEIATWFSPSRTQEEESFGGEIHDTGMEAKRLKAEILRVGNLASRSRSAWLRKSGAQLGNCGYGERAGKDVMKELAKRMGRKSAEYKHETDITVLRRFLEVIQSIAQEEASW